MERVSGKSEFGPRQTGLIPVSFPYQYGDLIKSHYLFECRFAHLKNASNNTYLVKLFRILKVYIQILTNI